MSTVGINNIGSVRTGFQLSEDVVPPELDDTERRNGTNQRKADDRYRHLSDTMLLKAIKAEESGAFIEIVARYQAIIFRYARNLGVDPADRKTWVADLLNDVVLSLVRPDAVIPDSLAAYFVRACHNRAYGEHRSRERRKRHEADAVALSHDPEGVVLSICSEYAIRGARGTDWEATGLPRSLLKLVSTLEGSMTPAERQLLDWSSEAVPLRVMAEWLGVNRAAVGQRVARLKQRMRALTPAIVSGMSEEEQHQVERFFSRAQVRTSVRELDLTDAKAVAP